MSSLEGRNSKKVLKRTLSLPLKDFSDKINQHVLIQSPSILKGNSEFLKNSDTDFELQESEDKINDFLGDRKEKNDLENLLGDIHIDSSSTDAESKEEILSILRNKKKVYASNILVGKLLIGEKPKNKFSYTKSNSLNQSRTKAISHEIPERISKPVFNPASY
jgi:hypothetical protein